MCGTCLLTSPDALPLKRKFDSNWELGKYQWLVMCFKEIHLVPENFYCVFLAVTAFLDGRR
jgi:hypothetical protein